MFELITREVLALEVDRLRVDAESQSGRWPSAAEAPEASARATALLEQCSEGDDSASEDGAVIGLDALRSMCCSLLDSPGAGAAERREREEVVGTVLAGAFSADRVLKVIRAHSSSKRVHDAAMFLIQEPLGQPCKLAPLRILNAGAAEACVAVLRARASHAMRAICALVPLSGRVLDGDNTGSACARRAVAAGVVGAVCEALSASALGEAEDWVGKRGELAGTTCVVLGTLVRNAESETLPRIIDHFGWMREQTGRGTSIMALSSAISGGAASVQDPGYIDSLFTRGGAPPTDADALSGFPVYGALLVSERVILAERRLMRDTVRDGGLEALHRRWKTPAEAAEEREALSAALAAAIRAAGGFDASVLRCCGDAIVSLVSTQRGQSDLLGAVHDPADFLRRLVQCGTLEALAEAGRSQLHTDDSKAFGSICGYGGLCCGLLGRHGGVQRESAEALERAIDAGLVRTIARSLLSAALRGSFQDLSFNVGDGTLILLEAVLRAPSGRACAEFIADEAAVGHLVGAIRGGAPAFGALPALCQLVDFGGSGGTTALRCCEMAARLGAPAAVTHAISACLSDRSLGGEGLRIALAGGVGSLSSLHQSGSLTPEETARARKALSSAQRQLTQRRAAAAAAGDLELLASLASSLKEVESKAKPLVQPPLASARLAEITKEADAKAAKALARSEEKKRQRAQRQIKQQQQQQQRELSGVAATCHACGQGPSPEGGAALMLCKGCRKVRFCSMECSRMAWKQGHKEECRAAAAAAAAATAARHGSAAEGAGSSC